MSTHIPPKPQSNWKLGFAAAIGAQILWGIFPAFIKLFTDVVEPVDLVAHRAIWSFVVLAILPIVLRPVASAGQDRPSSLRQTLIGDSKTVCIALVAAAMIAINWITFVWAVDSGHSLDASLGYYICPQLVVLLGVVFLRERLSGMQWTAIALATIGVTIMTWSVQSKVWIGLVVAIAFAFYALVKKKTKLAAVEGLKLETGFMLVPAFLFLCWRSTFEGVVAFPDSVSTWLLLVMSGPMTVAPLFLYAFSVKHISLSTTGLLQFIGPTIQFMLGVFAFAEPVDSTRIYGFVFVWVGVSLYLFALFRKSKPVSAS